ncbi:DUF1642 domain-containing protein [Listeria monocytogenes]|nr:DUF1642 domain-containing protein [Listeria monocytogenes]EHU3549110.1 DUF1642 domain-containing protein [Listeria monocytogenes]EHU3552229.1 DUF1642 domain-containing protein [Listeria monocytogenes]EHU3607690.1 DUF1642 domain-containing protein [Listeria monocytogenes]EHU3621557.1 DUF1642 domain-containing protein [Listeria monocytogenes]
MKFKKGDLVEVIWRSELYRGAVTRLVEATDEIEVKLAKKPAIDYLFKQNQVSKVELVKVPKFAADWIEYCEKHRWGLSEALEDTYENSCMPEEVMDWFEDCRENQELFARAWLDGYEVEKEPLYYVRLPYSSCCNATEKETNYAYIIVNKINNETQPTMSKPVSRYWKAELTEAEIKDMPAGDIYWQFAVLVDEAEGEA